MKNNKCSCCKRNKGFISKDKHGRKHWHSDKEHDLCYACWRNVRNRQRGVAKKAELKPFKTLRNYLYLYEDF